MSAPRLGVNIDHIATLRQLRNTPYPSILEAAHLVETAGAHQITVHLREDRRHIQDEDVKALKQHLKIALNLEMSIAPAIVRFAQKLKPQWSCLVPEKRQEVTTEGGLDVIKNKKKIADTIRALHRSGIQVSLFIEPDIKSVQVSAELGAQAVEFHTGTFSLATQQGGGKRSIARAKMELARIESAAREAKRLGICPHAGHGLDYENVRALVGWTSENGSPLIEEYNIGHSIVCRAAMVGLERAVREMLSAISAP